MTTGLIDPHALQWITPDWPAPASVRAISTTRSGGVSCAPYDHFNLADHVGDDPARVIENRRRLVAALHLPAAPAWLNQVHGTHVVRAEAVVAGRPIDADAVWTSQCGLPCVVMTADCLPVLLCDRTGTVVAAAHAGWRGLVNGILPATIAQLPVPPVELIAWLGPAIGPDAFEVGEEVRDTFLAKSSADAPYFHPTHPGKWLADLSGLARRQLQTLGINQIYGGDQCTFRESARFFSYRRDQSTGRMATLIWLHSPL